MGSFLFVNALIAHLIADFLLQNEWMATNKVSLRHSASWVHSGIHFVALLFVFPWVVALAVAVAHLLIDTRVPLSIWRQFYRQTNNPENPAFIPFAMWQDQVAHIIVLWLACVYLGRI
jgi:hypothetical protein